MSTRRSNFKKNAHFAPRGPGFLTYGLRIVYEDEYIIVLDKPAGLLTVASESESQRTVFRVVRDYLSARQDHKFHDARNEGAYLGVVHRLDRDTSGILFFVKTEEARRTLTSAWQELVSDRRYLAITEGTPNPAEGTVHNYLRQNKARRVYSSPGPEPGAEEAITHYKVVREVERPVKPGERRRCLVELKLETGRTNQIRVHMADLRCPIVGDKKYGLPGAEGRLALHARRIEFIHPGNGESVSFESPFPQELKKLIR